MSTPLVIVLVAAYAVSALVLLVCAAVGFGQNTIERVLEGIGAGICALNAIGVPFADHVTVWTFVWFLAPILALEEVARVRRGKKEHQQQLAVTYAIEEQERQARQRPIG